MKKVLSSLLSTTMLLSLSSQAFALDDKVLTDMQAQSTAIAFATTSMSDFVEPNNYRDDLVNPHAKALTQYLEDKRDLNRAKEALFGRDLSLNTYEVQNIQVEDQDSMYEVSFDIAFDYVDGDMPSALVVGYKVIIDKNSNTVLAAITNDLSGGSLINTTIGQIAKDLNLNYQFSSMLDANNTDIAKVPYDLEEKIDDLEAYWDAVQEEPTETQDISTFKFSVSPYARYIDFTSSDRANMRSYQDDWWSAFNPSYANFTSYGGDCTNYASQVLNSSSAPQYSSSSTGIQGTTYWYYKSSSNRSSSWTGVGEFRDFLLNNTTKGPTGYTVTTFGALESGDIIQLHNGSKFYHTVVVYTQGGDPWVTAHTSAYSGRYSTRYGGIDYSRVHISGYYK